MIYEPFTYKDFPSYDADFPGAVDAQGDTANLRCRLEDIEYQEGRILRCIFPHGQEEGITPYGRPFDPDNEEVRKNRKRYPLIVHVQGSGWFTQDMNDHIFDLMPIARMGYCIAIVQYHEAPGARFPQQVIDAKRALRFLSQHAEDYPIDISRVYLSGDSSGGQTALLTLLTYDTGELDEAHEVPLPRLTGAIDFYGVTDFDTLNNWWGREDFGKSPNIAALLGEKSKDPAARSSASPVSYVREEAVYPPLLILHGSKDTVVPFTQSLELFEKMKAQGHDCRFVRMIGGDHGGNIFYCDALYRQIRRFLEDCEDKA